MVLDAGFWAGITLYPESKCTPARAVDMIETAGAGQLWMNCACDWGQSDPLAVPKAAMEMRRRGFADAAIDALVFENPKRFLSQSGRFRIPGTATLPSGISQSRPERPPDKRD
jgi:predicted metal-dependent TIM-barrel fold hydrolase